MLIKACLSLFIHTRDISPGDSVDHRRDESALHGNSHAASRTQLGRTESRDARPVASPSNLTASSELTSKLDDKLGDETASSAQHTQARKTSNVHCDVVKMPSRCPAWSDSDSTATPRPSPRPGSQSQSPAHSSTTTIVRFSSDHHLKRQSTSSSTDTRESTMTVTTRSGHTVATASPTSSSTDTNTALFSVPSAPSSSSPPSSPISSVSSLFSRPPSPLSRRISVRVDAEGVLVLTNVSESGSPNVPERTRRLKRVFGVGQGESSSEEEIEDSTNMDDQPVEYGIAEETEQETEADEILNMNKVKDTSNPYRQRHLRANSAPELGQTNSTRIHPSFPGIRTHFEPLTMPGSGAAASSPSRAGFWSKQSSLSTIGPSTSSSSSSLSSTVAGFISTTSSALTRRLSLGMTSLSGGAASTTWTTSSSSSSTNTSSHGHASSSALSYTGTGPVGTVPESSDEPADEATVPMSQPSTKRPRAHHIHSRKRKSALMTPPSSRTTALVVEPGYGQTHARSSVPNSRSPPRREFLVRRPTTGRTSSGRHVNGSGGEGGQLSIPPRRQRSSTQRHDDVGADERQVITCNTHVHLQEGSAEEAWLDTSSYSRWTGTRSSFGYEESLGPRSIRHLVVVNPDPDAQACN